MSKNKMSGTDEARNALKLRLVSEVMNDLMGKVLTIIDASTEGDKNKALKDIIKQEFYNKMGWLSELAWKKELPKGDIKEVRNDWENYLVVVEEGKKYSFK